MAEIEPARSILKDFYVQLQKLLPLESDLFLRQLNSNNLLHRDTIESIKAKETRGTKVSYFLEYVIEPAVNIHLPTLLTVMEQSDDVALKKLAKDINRQFKKDLVYMDQLKNEDVFEAYTYLLSRIENLFKTMDFTKLKSVCVLKNESASKEFKQQITEAKNIYDILTLFDNPIYCNWLNVRLLKTIANNIDDQKIEKAIKMYEDHVYSRKVSDVKKYFKWCFDKKAMSVVEVEINKSYEDSTVKQIIDCCEGLENIMHIYTGAITAINTEPGCLRITIVIPEHCSLHAFSMAKINFIKLRQFHIQYLKIESFPKIFTFNCCNDENALTNLSPDFLKFSDPTEVINYYYTYLEGHMDADSVSHMMHYKHLITDDDYEAITAAPNDSKMNTVILQYIRAMDMSQLIKFCDILKGIETQKIIGDNLCASLEIAKKNSSSESKKSQKSSKNLVFLDFIDKLITQMSTADITALVKQCGTLMASYVHQIPLFTPELMNKLTNCSSPLIFKMYLLPYMSLFDCSILKQIIYFSDSKEDLEMIDDSVDYSQPIASYHIPDFSQLVIPLDDSHYTLLATKHAKSINEVTLSNLNDIKKSLVKGLDITDYAMQLGAIHIKSCCFYWLIPSKIRPLVQDNLKQVQEELWDKGIILTTILPANFYSDINISQGNMNNLFNFHNLSIEDPIEVNLMKRQITADRKEIKTVLKRQEELKIKLEETEIQKMKLNKEIAEYQSDMKIMQIKIVALRDDSKSLRKRIEANMLKMVEIKIQNEQLAVENQKHKIEKKKLNKDLKSATNQHELKQEELKTKLEENESQIVELSNKVAEYQSDIKMKELKIEALMGAFKERMEEKMKKDVEGIMQLHGDEAITKRQLREMVQQAKDEDLTIKVRHAKIMFCGASCAGKSSFSRLLQNKPHKHEYKSTPVAETVQVMSDSKGSNCPDPDDKKYLISEKVNLEGSSWVVLNSEKETERLTNVVYLLLKKQKEIEDDKNTNDSIHPSVSTASNEVNEQAVNNVQSPKKTIKEKTYHKSKDELSIKSVPGNQFPLPATDNQHSKSSNIEKDLPNESMQLHKKVLVEEDMANISISKLKEKIPETWDLFTLLDTGGQPEFIKMLPAINAFAAITFVVLNMYEVKKCLDTKVPAQYSDKHYNYPNHEMKYTNKELVECLLSSVRIAATVQESETFDKDFFNKIIVTSDHEHPKPLVCFIGTHADELENEYDDVVSYLNEEISGLEIIKYEDKSFEIFRNACTGKCLIAVDNTKNFKGIKNSVMETIQTNTSKAVKAIHEKSNTILMKSRQYTIPITWFILELEICKYCDINEKVCISLTEIKGICDQIMPSHKTMEIKVIKEVMKFYHMFGTLLYFHEVEDDDLNEIVITNPQWLFNNLTKIVMCKFDKEVYTTHDDIKETGICNENLLERLTLDLRQGVKIKSFLKLLEHLKVIAPLNNDQYFIPSVLPIRDSLSNIKSGEQFGKAVVFKINGEEVEVKEPLLITFKFGTIPRGLFGFLVVQLLQKNPELYCKNNLENKTYYCFADVATFRITPWWYFTIIDKISYLELHVRVKKDNPSYHHRVQNIVTEALEKVCSRFNWQLSDCHYGFLCKECTTKDHPSLLPVSIEALTISKIDDYTKCIHGEIMEVNEIDKRIWFEHVEGYLQHDVTNTDPGKSMPKGESVNAADTRHTSDTDILEPPAKQPKAELTSVAHNPDPSYYNDKPRMWDLIKIVIPKIKSEWRHVAYSMQYNISDINGIENDCSDSAKRCEKLFENWLATPNGITPKTWCTLLKCFRDVDELADATERIDGELKAK